MKKLEQVASTIFASSESEDSLPDEKEEKKETETPQHRKAKSDIK